MEPRLSYREKDLLYSEWAQLESSGIPLTEAAALLARRGTLRVRRTMRTFLESVREKESAGDVFHRAFGRSLDGAVLSATARSGRMDEGLRQLAQHYGLLRAIQREIFSNAAYPLFLLHFAVLALGIPGAVAGGGLESFLRTAGVTLLLLYGSALVIWMAGSGLTRAAGHAPAAELILAAVPFFGGLRAALARARFLSAFRLQLDAGINLLDAITDSARASGSAQWKQTAQRVTAKISHGESLADAFQREGPVTPDLARALAVAEASGKLDETLHRWAAESMEDARRRAGLLSAWLPRLLYLIIVLGIAWQVVSIYRGYLDRLLEWRGE